MSLSQQSSFSLPKFRDQLESFAFVLPAVLIFCIFYIVPFYEIFKLSLQEWDGISLVRTYIGFENFKELISDHGWWKSMWNAAYITLIALTFQNALAFALALACDQEIFMKGVYRVIFFIPPVLSEVVVGLIWSWILYSGMQDGQHIGLLNTALAKIGFSNLITNWLSNPKTVLTCIAVVHSWKGFGWGFIMFLAGLQTIDRQLYEAARVDGAGSFSVFKNVTVPMMLPVIVVVMILTILGAMQAFVLILTLAGSAGLGDYTAVPVTKILAAMTGQNRYGYACAMGVNFGMILIAVSFVLKKISERMKQA
ncbi:MAG TPA: sugar ABC transporter permease [Candidatus Omnitrophota bacterium]|nr:sugar ABC transporter permease [Candidatus Omnitrophota bacterium]HQO57776.1 sugar ABC transporter permease [Candidatus Omnitrophota bacterium]